MTTAPLIPALTRRQTLRALGALAAAGALSACASPPIEKVDKAAMNPDLAPVPAPSPATLARYQAVEDGGYTIPAVDPGYLVDSNPRALVYYNGTEPVGTIVVDPYARRLYLVLDNGLAIRYGVAVGRAGKGYSGNAVIRRKAKWPSWRPTDNMLATEPERYGDYAQGLEGGPENPLGARALYLYHNGRDTYYRIHGTNNASTIGRATSAGCIRLFNQDAIDLYQRVPLDTPVHVRSSAESLQMVGAMRPGFKGYVVPVADPDVEVTGPTADAILDNSAAATDAAIAAATAAVASGTAPGSGVVTPAADGSQISTTAITY
jgi:lipoprotein-anchoring transpeptidase ErfK/SrfK